MFQYEGRFPEAINDIPDDVSDFVAQQLGLTPTLLLDFQWNGRTARRQRRRIRELHGFRTITTIDQEQLRDWLIMEALPNEHRPVHLTEIAYQQLRHQHIEPPTQGRLARLIDSARYRYDQQFYATTVAQLPAAVKANLQTLIHVDHAAMADSDEPEQFYIHDLKTGIGATTINNIKQVSTRLAQLQEIALPTDLFSGISWRYLQQLAQQTAVESVSHLQRHENQAQTLTLLAAFCWVRQRRITDQLVDLFIQVLNDIRLRAKHRVERELLTDFIRVGGKQQLLFKLAEAMWDNPEGIIQDVLFPLIGKERLQQLVEESKQTGSYYRSVQTRISGSWTHHYRPLLPLLLNILQFRSNNAQHQTLLKGLNLIADYTEEIDPYYPLEETVPLEGVIQKQWHSWIYQTDKEGRRRVRRVRYELCVLQSLRDKLRAREIWIEGANRYRNPDEDVPADFEQKRESYYEALSLPQSATKFVSGVKQQLTDALQNLNDELPTNSDVEILQKDGGWIHVASLTKQSDPRNLRRLKNHIKQQWWMTDLLDIFKEVDMRVGFTEGFPSLTGQERLSATEKRKRLLLCLFGLGTNTGLTSVSMGNHGATYANLQYVRRRFIARDPLRQSTTQNRGRVN